GDAPAAFAGGSDAERAKQRGGRRAGVACLAEDRVQALAREVLEDEIDDAPGGVCLFLLLGIQVIVRLVHEFSRSPRDGAAGLNLRQGMATPGLFCGYSAETPSDGGGGGDMTRASTGLHGAGDRLAAARDRFLASQPVDRAVVREPILASWWRSKEWKVEADRLRLAYLREPDLESTLARAAEPVLRHLHDQLDGQPISVVLTDAAGLVLLRYTGDHDLERHLDSIMLAPGFSYAENVVGTNGIGTALESGGPAHVFGHEHYAERLEGMACAGVPLKDPVSGKTLGVLDLTCWRRDADPLMISLVRSTGDQLTQALAETSSSRDLRLLQEYTRACRHTGGIVLALGNDVVMLNDRARRALSPADQAALISQATETLSAEAMAAGVRGRLRAPGAVTVDLPSGAVARMFCRPVGEFGMLAASGDSRPAAGGP